MRLTSSRAALVALLLLFLFVTALAATRLNSAMWTDEMMTLYHVGAVHSTGAISLQESLARIATDPWQAPLYFVLAYIWGQFVGWSPFALRVLSLFFGVLALALLYRFVRRNFSAQAALYAVLLTGMGAFFINYLHDMRGYTLVMLSIIVLLMAYQNAVRATVTARHDLLLIAAVALVFYTHYFAIIGVLALGVYHLIFGFRRPRFWRIIADFVLGGVLFLPWSLVFVQGLLLSKENVRSVFNMTPPETVYNVLYMFSNGALALLLLLLILAVRIRTRPAVLTWFWLLVSLAIVIGVSRVFTSLFAVRYLIFLWLPLGVLAGLGAAELVRRKVPAVALLGVWLVACLWNFTSPVEQNRILPIEYRPPFDALHAQVEEVTQPGDALMYHLPPLAPNDLMHPELLDYYLRDLDLRRSVLIADTEATTEELYASNVQATVSDAQRVWLTYETARRDWHIGPTTERTLPEAGFAFCGALPEAGMTHAELWARRALDPNRLRLDFVVGNGSQIALQPQQVTPLDAHHAFVAMQWAAGDLPPADYSLGVHFLDESGQLVAQLDRGLDVFSGCTAQIVELDAAPESVITVRAGIYNWQTGERFYSEDGANDWSIITGIVIPS